jgi:translation initiation factor 2B subunit (eIF-2B alpha/beta/delta family)
MVSEIAHKYDVPRYACTFSWKFDPKTVLGTIEKLESRNPKEIWPNHPKKLKISNIVFEETSPELITGIISDLGVLEPATFISELEKIYPFIFSK